MGDSVAVSRHRNRKRHHHQVSNYTSTRQTRRRAALLVREEKQQQPDDEAPTTTAGAHNNNNNSSSSPTDDFNSDSPIINYVSSKQKRKLLKDVSHDSHNPPSPHPPPPPEKDKQNTSLEHVRSARGSPSGQRPVSHMPDAKVLFTALDKLQKKDTYGVFSEPVDPEELPDYFDIIENPMDFSTIRKNIESGKYANLDQIENDILLLCSNAMTYNAPSTVYHRQARSIQELAKKTLEALRSEDGAMETENEDKSAIRTRSGTIIKKTPRRPGGTKSQVDSTRSDIVSSVTLASSSEHIEKHSEYREKPNSEMLSDGMKLKKVAVSETYACQYNRAEGSNIVERVEEQSGFLLKGSFYREGKKDLSSEESRRDTYRYSNVLFSENESILTMFYESAKQLLLSGVPSEFAYARSLANFAADVGPLAWECAARKIEKVLPSNVPFGQGWVGKNEVPASSLLHQIKHHKVLAPPNTVSSTTSAKTTDLKPCMAPQSRGHHIFARTDSPDKENSDVVLATSSICTTVPQSLEFPVPRTTNESWASSAGPNSNSQVLHQSDPKTDLPYVGYQEMNFTNPTITTEVSQSRLLEIVSRNNRYSQWALASQAEKQAAVCGVQKTSVGSEHASLESNNMNSSFKESGRARNSSSMNVFSNGSEPNLSVCLERKKSLHSPFSTSAYESSKADLNWAVNFGHRKEPCLQQTPNVAVSNQMTTGIVVACSRQSNEINTAMDLWSQPSSSDSAYFNANASIKQQWTSTSPYNPQQIQGGSLINAPGLVQQQVPVSMPFYMQTLNRMNLQNQSKFMGCDLPPNRKFIAETPNSNTMHNYKQISMTSESFPSQQDLQKSFSTNHYYHQNIDHLHSGPPDLNMGCQSSNSSMATSDIMVDPHPDLALQL